MDEETLRALVGSARVGRLATVTATGKPHVVPMVFALDGNLIYSAVDHKPKSTQRLQRLNNIAAHPAVALLVDHYSDDWSELWWVRIDGTARVIETGPAWERAAECLADKYPQYRGVPPDGPAIAIAIVKMTGWSAG